jgi:hypothetical protein
MRDLSSANTGHMTGFIHQDALGGCILPPAEPTRGFSCMVGTTVWSFSDAKYAAIGLASHDPCQVTGIVIR